MRRTFHPRRPRPPMAHRLAIFALQVLIGVALVGLVQRLERPDCPDPRTPVTWSPPEDARPAFICVPFPDGATHCFAPPPPPFPMNTFLLQFAGACTLVGAIALAVVTF